MYTPHKGMDKYISRFMTETGCQLELERGSTGICFKAMSSSGQCLGQRYLSTSQLGNGALVQAVMLDFIAQVKRLLELDGQTVSMSTDPFSRDSDPARHR
ncbi:hypothetical protein [Pseudomonas argentinensis]|uniref:hypothetical protein n=1 Tax=Phytopseudomonas argentinensis TaxID=289370 RepID=UPI0008A8AA13|nr:hypothetical protein [Pseudomonas argentinensis]